MELFCGLDCGGTKTLCVLADENGKIAGTGKGGPSNYLFSSRSLACQSIRDSIHNAFYNAGLEPCRVAYTYVASAAIEVNNGEKHIPLLSACMDTKHLYANSDVVPVWFAGTDKDAAIVAVSGTGSATYAFWGENYIKAGGWGSLLGDEGSGYDIGRRAINAATRTQDSREGNTSILRAVLNHFGINELRSIHKLLRNGDQRSLIASVAQCVCELFENGDPVAAEILQYAAKEIALSIETVAKIAAFGEPVPLIVSGSLLQHRRPLYSLLRQQLYGSDYISRICSPQISAAESAAAMALYESGRSQSARRLLRECEADGI